MSADARWRSPRSVSCVDPGLSVFEFHRRRRTVAIPPHVLPDLEALLSAWAEPGAGGLLFPAPEGGPIRRSNFTRRVWHPACQAVGIEGLRFHDLRHTGNTLAAATGASTRELMARMGHASPVPP